MSLTKLAAAAALVLGAASAQAAPTVALYLTMDASGSIDATEMSQQKSSYVNALNALFTADPSLFGKVAIGGGIFGRDFSQFFAVTAINNAGNLAALTSAISGLSDAIAGRGITTTNTAIGDAITASKDRLVAYEQSLLADIKLVIDVTTDGLNNFGSNPNTVANALQPNPIDAVNCLGIGAGADCSWVAGAGNNFGSATNFQTLEAALQIKLRQEINRTPEPGTLALVGLAIAGLGFGARRRG
ncbi:VWFA domain-containing protein [Rubrivivax sp. A210]|uniref:DUF1194 domain-containing protein n=1 Tax=Rubrivivax sp. A210 TaxID=2772301 RepID=UPI00191B0A7A|nr:DUF1194 domain-containing protein [Rubrivivax sp. A210]CAD5374130.1 VWFA domain-containing protein [Rubrivivax sp. A210]